MRYSIILFCLLFTFGKHSLAQTDTLQSIQVYALFSDSQKAEWTSFTNNWQYYEYPKFLQKAQVKKLSCSKCEGMYADIYMEVDETGKIIKAVFLKGSFCGSQMPAIYKRDFENSVLKTSFQYIKKQTFIARFGNVLKC
ncbi:MAG: hypothetical protein JST26_17005 [Bacteroidetes bacterium]|nr:hypothetical protein [Bacteroidota bacterium]